jgi:hypothetical protein
LRTKLEQIEFERVRKPARDRLPGGSVSGFRMHALNPNPVDGVDAWTAYPAWIV